MLYEVITVDSWVQDGTVVPPNYDPMLAKLIAYGGTREQARAQLIAALNDSVVSGIETNRAYLAQVLDTPDFIAGKQITRMLEGFHYRPATIDVRNNFV